MSDTNRSSVDRRVEGPFSSLLINVSGGVTVCTGDLMFIDDADNLRNNGSSISSSNGYPISYLRSGTSIEQNKDALKERFLGVAIDDKDGVSNGGDSNIPVLTGGKFSFPLKPAKTVNAGDYFGPSGTTTDSDMFDQKVMKTSFVTRALGYFAERKVHALTAEVFLRTKTGSLGLIK